MTSLGRGKTAGIIKDRLIQLNLDGGRCGRDMQFPVDWEASGFFQKVESEGEFYIQFRLTGAKVRIPHVSDDIDIDCIEILSNFSKARAIASVDGEQFKVLDLFASSGQPLPVLRLAPVVGVKRQTPTKAKEEDLPPEGVAAESEEPLPKVPKTEGAAAPAVTPKKVAQAPVKGPPEEQEPVSPADEAAGMAPAVRSPHSPPRACKHESTEDDLAADEAAFQPMVS